MPSNRLLPVLMVGGTLLLLVGAVNLALFFISPQFGSVQWEFATIGQAFDALALPTVGLIFLALGVRSRGGTSRLPRSLAALFLLAAALSLAAAILFVLDIPPMFRALAQSNVGSDPQALANASLGLKRAAGRTLFLALCYTAAFLWLARIMWRNDDR